MSDQSVQPEATVGPQAPPTNDKEQPLTGWAAVYDFVMQSYCWFVIFFALYVLSIGPFYQSWRNAVDLGERPVLQALYMPLAGLCEKSETVNTVVDWYVSFWQS